MTDTQQPQSGDAAPNGHTPPPADDSRDMPLSPEDTPDTPRTTKKILFAALAIAVILGLIIALVTFVDNRPRANQDLPEPLPATSIVGWWTSFCPAHNTLVADADNINIHEGESTEDYLKRLDSSLERQAADFRDAALMLNTSSVMMKGSDRQKEALRELVAVLQDGDKVFTAEAQRLRTNPIRTQEDMDRLGATLATIYERYSKAVTAATGAIGLGDTATRRHIEKLSECKQLLNDDNRTNRPTQR